MKRLILLLAGLVIMAALILAPGLGCKGTEETITGNVTEEGRLLDENGIVYAMVGDKSAELKGLVGKKFEVTGMVKDRLGEKTISIQEYVLLNDTPKPPHSSLEEMEMQESAIEPVEEAPDAEYDLE